MGHILSRDVNIATGIRQGYSLNPFLFSNFLDQIIGTVFIHPLILATIIAHFDNYTITPGGNQSLASVTGATNPSDFRTTRLKGVDSKIFLRERRVIIYNFIIFKNSEI